MGSDADMAMLMGALPAFVAEITDGPVMNVDQWAIHDATIPVHLLHLRTCICLCVCMCVCHDIYVYECMYACIYGWI